MTIEKINYNGSGITHITPAEGKVLVKDGIYSESVYLGINDAIENWHEEDAVEEME